MQTPRRPAAADAQLLATLERAFAKHAGADGVIDLKELQKALGLRSEYLARRVLVAFDRNADGVIRRDEFLDGVRTLVFGTDRDKLLFAFRLYDHDGDGTIDRQELMRMIAISLSESEAWRASQPPEHLAHVLFSIADKNKDGKISFDEFEAVVQRRPALLQKMTRSEALWIAPNEDLLLRIDDPQRKRPGRAARYFENSAAPTVIVALWAIAHCAVFALSMGHLKTGDASNPMMQVGRALGRCIDLDGALILFPMMRRLLTWVRSTWLGRVIPVDEAITFHKIVGHTLFALAVAHTAAFTMAYASGHGASRLAHLLATGRGATGIALLLVFAVMWISALGFIRRSSRFELFYFTHLLYLAWLGLAIAHARPFLVFAGVPLLGFVIEQIRRLKRRAPASQIVSAAALRSGVTRLELTKPPGFDCGPGDYVFLRIPKIARHEWHPFTISSAPEHSHLTFHVRSLGNWTSALRRRVEANEAADDLVAYVDGPYGSPSAHIFESRYAVLIGAGIGVTPFASVLESLVLRANGSSDRPSKLEKVHFFWLNRDQYSFEWFAQLLSELERIDQNGLAEFHLCMTGGRSGATALGLELAREILHAAGRSDIITGLRTKTHMGPPDFDRLLGAIAARHPGEHVDVYFCGPPGLGAKIRGVCERLKMRFREERF